MHTRRCIITQAQINIVKQQELISFCVPRYGDSLTHPTKFVPFFGGVEFGPEACNLGSAVIVGPIEALKLTNTKGSRIRRCFSECLGWFEPLLCCILLKGAGYVAVRKQVLLG